MTPEVFKDEITTQPGDNYTAQRLVDLIQRPRLGLKITAGAEATDVRAITVQVVNRLLVPRKGRFLVTLWISDSAGGPPAGGQVVGSPSAGYVVKDLTTNSVYMLGTDADGKIVLPVTVSGGATKHVCAVILTNVVGLAVEWT